jgi:hypothetical protein
MKKVGKLNCTLEWGREAWVYLFVIINWLPFKLLPGEGGVGLFFIFCFLITLFILSNFFGIFFTYFLKGGRRHKLFKNLLRGEGIGLISLFYQGYC